MFRRIAMLASFSLLLCGCFADMCGNDMRQTVPSPSGRLNAVVFSRDCGATTGFSTQVSIIPAGSALPNEAGNTFVISGTADLAIQWQTDSALSIQGAGGTVFKQEAQVNGVAVRYASAR